MTGDWFGKRTVEVPCTVDIEHTPASLHAYVELDGFEVGPGDTVRVHDAPTDVGFGDHVVVERRATIVPAGPLARLWAHVEGWFELTELYEVSFTTRRFP